MAYSIEKDFVRFEHPEGAAYGQIIADLKDLMNNPGLTRRMNFLIDLRSLPAPLEADDMRNLATYLERVKDRIGPRLSFIVQRPVVYGMIRLLGSHISASNLSAEIFDNEEDAIAWLAR